MNCDDVRALLGPFLDDEIADPLLCRRVADHIEACKACSKELEALSAVRRSLREAPPRFEAPAGLRAKIEAAAGMKAPPTPSKRKRKTWVLFPVGALAAALALILFLTDRTSGRIEDDLVADHVRSLQADHLFDVASTDQHTVKPWFQGKLDFSPAVPQLADQGFPLVGGRLDYVNKRPAAALVYRRNKHVINVLVTKPMDGGASSGVEDRDGYHVLHWAAGGLDYWAISDVNPADLIEFKDSFLRAAGF